MGFLSVPLKSGKWEPQTKGSGDTCHGTLKGVTAAGIQPTINPDGTGKSSIRGAARLVGVSDSALVQAFGAKPNSHKLAQSLTAQGFQVLSFCDEGIPDTALSQIRHAWTAHRRPSTRHTHSDYN